MRHHARHYALAFVAATVAALVVDAALQLALEAVRVSAANRAPWWVTANLVGRGRWVVFALLLWLIASRLPAAALDTVPPGGDTPAARAWMHVAAAVIGVPLLWVLATWLVSALRFTALGTWATDGRVFVDPNYYRAIVLDLAPWLMAAAATAAIGRHVEA